MATITKVKLDNWKSHHQSEFAFSDGVNVLVGDMGSGKSSVLEAICFALYGTSPNLKSNIVNLDNMLMRSPSKAKSACVELELEIKGKKYSIKREIKRDKGTANCEIREEGSLLESPQSTKVTDVVNSLLGLDFDLFSRALYAEQDNLDYFLNLRSGKRKEEIDSLLKLDRFEKARKSSVRLKNRLKSKIDDRRKDLESYDLKEIDKKLSSLKNDIKRLKEEKKEIKSKISKLGEKVSEKKEKLEELKQKQTTCQQLDKQITELESKIETLQEQVKRWAQDSNVNDKEYELKQIKQRIEDKQEELKRAERRKEEIKDVIKKKTELNSELKTLKQDIQRLEEKEDKKRELESTKEELSQQRDKLEELESELNQTETRLQDKKDALQALSNSEGECPVCRSEISTKRKDEVEEERQGEIDQLKKRQSEQEERIKKEKKELKRLEDKKEKLAKYEGLEERLQEKKNNREETKERLTKLEDVESEEKIEERIEELKKSVEGHKRLKEIKERKKTIEERKKDLKSLRERKQTLEFDKDELETIAQEFQQLDKQREVAESERRSKKAILQEKEGRLEDVEENLERVNSLKEEVERFKTSEKKAIKLSGSLSRTQESLREKFVSSVNQAMNTIWRRVYPYEGYHTLRLHGKEDYSLELKENGDWFPVEGEVSGGERQSAALALRIALALVLAPNFRILILDEPTHNLDVNAINELAQTLRTKVSDLVEQLFVITHEERLEEAVTAKFYRLKKENGISQITQAR